jgi:hypothetical protein
VIFEEVTRSESSLYVQGCTAVRPHYLPLVAAHLSIERSPVMALNQLRRRRWRMMHLTS